MNTLTADVINEMQRNNNPNVFGIDQNGNQGGSNMSLYSQAYSGQMLNGGGAIPNSGGIQQQQQQMPQYQQQMQPQFQQQMQPQFQQQQQQVQAPSYQQLIGGNNPNQQMQINPQLTQQFLYIIDNVPQLKAQYSSNQEEFNKALSNVGLMMDVVARYSDSMQQQQQNQPQQQQQMQQQEQNGQDGGRVDHSGNGEMGNPNMMIDDINLLDEDKSYSDMIYDIIKYPLFISILFIILTNNNVKNFILNAVATFIPQIKYNTTYELIVVTSVFFITTICLHQFI